MTIFVIVLGIILTFFSVAILSYVSIATMMGPWIAPTLVLLATIIAKFRGYNRSKKNHLQDLLLIQAIAAGGGVIAVGVGFSLPILFFLDQQLFNNWLSDITHFCTLMGVICLVAGGLGIVWGQYISSHLINRINLPFPTSQITYQLAALPSKDRHIKQLLWGGVGTFLISLFRDGIGAIQGCIPKVIKFCWGHLAFPIWPTMWVIGFTAGQTIALPLLVGLITQKLLAYAVTVYSFGLAREAFVTAFCAGLILSEICLGGLSMLLKLRNKQKSSRQALFDRVMQHLRSVWQYLCASSYVTLAVVVAASALFFYFNFSIPAQLMYFVLLFLATYEISFLGAEIGLVPFGRFSTFILIPFMLLFKFSYVQLTFLCVFFSVCAASASDFIFDDKIGDLGGLDKKKLYAAQWIGLVAASLSIGIILYLLLTHLSLGSPEFYGQRGQSKALMIKSLDFNLYVVGVGFVYGLLLKRFGIAPLMTFGGIIMPSNITIGLLAGSLLSRYVQVDRYIAICSGVLVSEVIWIMISIAAKLLL